MRSYCFSGTASTFNEFITVNADDGVAVNKDVTSTTGNLDLYGNVNGTLDGLDTVTFYDGTTTPAKLVGADADSDLAVLKVAQLPAGASALPLGNMNELAVGQTVVAIGNPFGLSHTVTSGIVSAKGRVIGSGPYDDFIQTDASSNPGTSSGARQLTPTASTRGDSATRAAQSANGSPCAT